MGKEADYPLFFPPFWPYSPVLILHFKVCYYAMSMFAQEKHFVPPSITRVCSSSVVVNLFLLYVSITSEQIWYRCNALQGKCHPDLLPPPKKLHVSDCLVNLRASLSAGYLKASTDLHIICGQLGLKPRSE